MIGEIGTDLYQKYTQKYSDELADIVVCFLEIILPFKSNNVKFTFPTFLLVIGILNFSDEEGFG